MTIYNYEVTKINDEKISMENYRGKVLLIVNTASKCGFTKQFEELENIYKEYKDEGFEILGFPCSQFKNQELESNDAINTFCKINYGVTFTMFKKIDVNGENADPMFKYLKSNSKALLNKEIKWNFTKFLVDREGNVIKRYAPITSPYKIKEDIDKLM